MSYFDRSIVDEWIKKSNLAIIDDNKKVQNAHTDDVLSVVWLSIYVLFPLFPYFWFTIKYLTTV